MAQAIFYKREMKLLSKRVTELTMTPGISFILAAHLKVGDEANSIELVFATTHLKAMPEYERMRKKEVNAITQAFESSYNNLSVPVILVGDFNDVPLSEPINMMEKSFVDLHVLKIEKIKQKYGYAEKFKDRRNDYPKYTIICDTNKVKDEPKIEHLCLDYMFVYNNQYMRDSHLQIKASLELPPIQDGLVPSETHPSDHFSLVYDVVLEKSEKVEQWDVHSPMPVLARQFSAPINIPARLSVQQI